jgi:hypothetical protein
MAVLVGTVIIRCELPNAEADALNRASSKIYTQTKVEYYRIYREHGIWLSAYKAEHLPDRYEIDGTGVLHVHSSIDATQQDFHTACKGAKAAKKVSQEVHYAKHNKFYRTTIWKSTGLQLQDGVLKLSWGRQSPPFYVALPPTFAPK